jgi:hypothetical protein
MTELEAMRPILDAIPPDEIDEPPLPMAVALQEANDLHTTLGVDDTRERLVTVGVDPAALDQLATAVAATRQAQSQWVVVRDRGKPAAQSKREQAGVVMRSDLVAACRWSLRREPTAQAVVDAIVEGEGVADMVQDLLDLAMLVDRHTAAFDADQTFDAPAQIEAARSGAEQITAGLSQSRTPGDHQAAKALRDRAYTYLAELVSDVRQAGRYAFRKQPKRASAFGSAYLRRAAARTRRRAARKAVTPGDTQADAGSQLDRPFRT